MTPSGCLPVPSFGPLRSCGADKGSRNIVRAHTRWNRPAILRTLYLLRRALRGRRVTAPGTPCRVPSCACSQSSSRRCTPATFSAELLAQTSCRRVVFEFANAALRPRVRTRLARTGRGACCICRVFSEQFSTSAHSRTLSACCQHSSSRRWGSGRRSAASRHARTPARRCSDSERVLHPGRQYDGSKSSVCESNIQQG